ncbi:MAG: TonB-dependent receptor [Maricaulaceae bacterium]
MFNRSLLLGSSILLSAAIAAPASAQMEDEIIVTATKRETTLQATPVAVSVTPAVTIEQANILDIGDLQSIVPSLKVTQLQTSSNTNFIIRGFGNGANNAGIEPSVGIFIDGVYRSRSAARIGDLPSLERIEVLKGPQSTLFGKNASAGVISVVTAKPSFEPEGYVELGYGNHNQRIAKGYFSGPLSEDFAVSLGGSIQKRDGYAESAIAGQGDINDRNRFSLRGQALYQPSDAWELRLIADISTIDEACCVVTNIQNQGAAAAITALGGQLASDTDPFSYIGYSNALSVNTVDDMGISFHADVDLGWASVTSITSYRENEAFNDQDADFNSLNLLDSVNFNADIETFTQELRLTSQSEGPLQWMLGGYFFTEEIAQRRGLEYGTDLRSYIGALLGDFTLLGTLEGLYGQTPGAFFNPDAQIEEIFSQSNDAYSLFGTVDYEVSDKLTLTVGANYTDDKKSVTGRTVNSDVWSSIDLDNDLTLFGVPLSTVLFGQTFTGNTGLPATPANIAFIESVAPGTSAAISAGVASGIAGIQSTQFQPQFVAFPNAIESGKTHDDKLTYIARLAYEVNDNINVYGSYGTGFKATSWNLSGDSRPFVADSAAVVAGGLSQPNQTFGTRYAAPENASVIELGLKSRFEKGAVNVAVFDQTIKGFQSNIFGGVGFFLSNAGKQSVRGAELDVFYSPVDALDLSFSGMYLDPEYDSFVGAQGPNGPIDLSGETPSGIAELSLSVAATYKHDFGNGTEGFLRGDFQYESPTQIVDNIVTVTNSAGQTSKVEREVKTFNAAAGVSFENGVSLQLWGRNIFNDEYLLSAFPGVAQAGVVNAYPNAPRTYGANLRYSF